MPFGTGGESLGGRIFEGQEGFFFFLSLNQVFKAVAADKPPSVRSRWLGQLQLLPSQSGGAEQRETLVLSMKTGRRTSFPLGRLEGPVMISSPSPPPPPPHLLQLFSPSFLSLSGEKPMAHYLGHSSGFICSASPQGSGSCGVP